MNEPETPPAWLVAIYDFACEMGLTAAQTIELTALVVKASEARQFSAAMKHVNAETSERMN